MTTDTPGIQTETLERRLARGPMDSVAALDILRGILKVLAFRHWSGASHGGVTPKAIAIAPDGQVTIRGFRTATGVDAESPGGAGLDPRYMAPEQITGVPADAQSDVFAVGIIAYEMLAGQHPFGADKAATGREVMSHIVDWPLPQLPAAVLAGLPAYVGPALDGALAKDRDIRFANAEVFLAVLRDPEPQAEAAAVAVAVAGAARASRRRKSWFRYYGLPVAAALIVLIGALDVWTYVTRTPTVVTILATTSLPATSSTSSPTTVTTASTITTTTAIATTTTASTAVSTTASTKVPTFVTLGVAPGATRFEDASEDLAYSGTWVVAKDPAYSGGSLQYANGAGAAVTASFSGTGLAWIAKKGSAYGKAKVTLDGKTSFTVDLYGATEEYRAVVWSISSLAAGDHTVKIEWTGTKNGAATATNINVDAVDVDGTLR